MRLIRLRFRVRSLLLLVAVAAIVSGRVVLWLRSPPKLMVQGVRLRSPGPGPGASHRYRSPGLGWVFHRKVLAARDSNLIYYSFIHLHGRELLGYSREDVLALRHHLNPGGWGGGTLLADADPRNPGFDTAFRQFVDELFPNRSLVPIPTDDELYSDHAAGDLSDVQYSHAAGGRRGHPRLEGVRVNGRWAIIYSKDDLSCALEKDASKDLAGYTPESAAKIFDTILLHSIEP